MGRILPFTYRTLHFKNRSPSYRPFTSHPLVDHTAHFNDHTLIIWPTFFPLFMLLVSLTNLKEDQNKTPILSIPSNRSESKDQSITPIRCKTIINLSKTNILFESSSSLQSSIFAVSQPQPAKKSRSNENKNSLIRLIILV